jgi:regulator of RNase E activity RraA
VADFRCPIEIGGVWIEPGDLIFADQDGVLVIPRELEVEVITRALRKAREEKVVRRAIEGGMTATDAFKTYGIL